MDDKQPNELPTIPWDKVVLEWNDPDNIPDGWVVDKEITKKYNLHYTDSDGNLRPVTVAIRKSPHVHEAGTIKSEPIHLHEAGSVKPDPTDPGHHTHF